MRHSISKSGSLHCPVEMVTAEIIDDECSACGEIVACEGHEHDPSIPTSVAGETIYCDGSCVLVRR